MRMMRLTNGSVTMMSMVVFSIEHSWNEIRLSSLLCLLYDTHNFFLLYSREY
jgi:hypothetical protein